MRRAQRGFALVAAIVLITVLAALAGFVAVMASGQGAAQQLERSSRVADLAASAGLEWGAYRVLRQSAACPFVTPLPALPGSLGVMAVTVSCVPAGTGFQITAIARNGINPAVPDYVERSKTVVFTP